jgi:signal transduction histidine kinase
VVCLTDVPRLARAIVAYLAGILAGGTLAVLAAHYRAQDNVYVMFAVLLVVAAALLGGTGPAIAVAITAVVGDDLVLTGRLPPLDQWRDELVFGTIAITVGLLVSAKRKQQLRAQRLAVRERELRAERDAILAAISHDVRNPLAVISGSARSALVSRETKGDVARLFRRIDAAASQAAHLIDVLSDLHSIDGNALELDLRRDDLRQAVETAIDQMEVLAQGHALRYSAPAGPVLADFDRHRIQRVLQNVIGNAVKYSPDGGDIDVEVRVEGGDAIVSVRDRGMGIAEAERGRVFERGYRARGVDAIQGSGLGLFISAEIVKRHHGTITCDAALGGGTIVDVRLPLARLGLPAEPVQQLPGDRPGLAVADRAVVDGHDGHRLAGRAGEKRFVGAE